MPNGMFAVIKICLRKYLVVADVFVVLMAYWVRLVKTHFSFINTNFIQLPARFAISLHVCIALNRTEKHYHF